MANLPSLIRGTQIVLPTTLKRSVESDFTILQINISNFVGVKTRLISAVVLSKKSNKIYRLQMNFLRIEDFSQKIPLNNNLLVRCSCPAYYFWFGWANFVRKIQFAGRVKKYVRKTPPPPEGYPYKNPKNIPGICKHLVVLSKELRKRNYIR